MKSELFLLLGELKGTISKIDVGTLETNKNKTNRRIRSESLHLIEKITNVLDKEKV